MPPTLLDDLVDRELERLLDRRGSVSVRKALSAITFAYGKLQEDEQIQAQTEIFSAAIAARIESRLQAPRDLVRATVKGEPGLARRAPRKRLDA